MFTTEEIKSLNELEMEVYRYVVDHRSAIPYMRIRELAAEAHVSTTTVLRFCKKFGCESYSEFKSKVRDYVGANKEIYLKDDRTEIDRFFTERVSSVLFQSKVDEISAVMAKTERILFFGIGNSLHVAQYGARFFTNIGKFSLCVTDPFYPTRLVDTISTLAIMISISGESVQILEFAQDLQQKKCPIISLTGSSDCSLAKMADYALTTGVKVQRRDSVDYTTNVPTVYILELLAKRLGGRLQEQ